MLAGTTPLCHAGSGSTALRPPPLPPPSDPALRPIAPGDFARGAGPRVVAGRVDHDRGTADGNDIGRGGRIVRGDLVTAVAVDPGIARGGEEGDARGGEVRVERLLVQPRRGEGRLGLAITQGDDRDPRKLRGLLHRFDQVFERGGRVVGLVGRVVNDDRRTGGDRVRPLDVERGLADNVDVRAW